MVRGKESDLPRAWMKYKAEFQRGLQCPQHLRGQPASKHHCGLVGLSDPSTDNGR